MEEARPNIIADIATEKALGPRPNDDIATNFLVIPWALGFLGPLLATFLTVADHYDGGGNFTNGDFYGISFWGTIFFIILGLIRAIFLSYSAKRWSAYWLAEYKAALKEFRESLKEENKG